MKKVLLYQILGFTIYEKKKKKKKKMKTSYSNNKLKILVPKWSDEFELPGGSYFISDVQDYFEYI